MLIANHELDRPRAGGTLLLVLQEVLLIYLYTIFL